MEKREKKCKCGKEWELHREEGGRHEYLCKECVKGGERSRSVRGVERG